jgi:hypothetical protein
MLIFLALLAAEQCVAVKLAADPAESSITASPNFAAWLSVGPNSRSRDWLSIVYYVCESGPHIKELRDYTDRHCKAGSVLASRF